MPKENLFFFVFPRCSLSSRRSLRDTNKRAKMQINLQFSAPPCILLPALNREGQGEGLYFRLSQYVKDRFNLSQGFSPRVRLVAYSYVLCVRIYFFTPVAVVRAVLNLAGCVAVVLGEVDTAIIKSTIISTPCPQLATIDFDVCGV